MIAIVGGGAIGLSCAWRLAQQGADVAVFERGPIGGEASFAAGGMLAPSPEFWLHQQDENLRQLGAQSRDLYPEFSAELLETTGVDIELCLRNSPTSDWRVPGITMVSPLAANCENRRDWNGQAACWFADEGQVEPRHLTRALRLACEQSGVWLRQNTPVRGVKREGNCLTHLLISDEQFAVSQVVLCAGAWSGQLSGLSSAELPQIRPVAGQMLQLRGEHRLNHIVYGEDCYLIPRRDGRLLVGATVEETGFEKRVTRAATAQLLKAARTLAPLLESAPLETSWAGLRPVSSNETPILGGGPIENLSYATGHGRNGILLAPRTAQIITGYLSRGEAVPEAFEFARVAVVPVG